MHAALRVIGQDEGEGTKARVGPENAVPWPLYCCAMRDSVPLDGDRVRKVTPDCLLDISEFVTILIEIHTIYFVLTHKCGFHFIISDSNFELLYTY